MGTRGAIATRVGGVDRVHYNHYDSYPSALGFSFLRDVLAMLQAEAEYKAKAVAIQLVDESSTPTEDDRKKYAKFFQQVSTGADWYALLRDLQGELKQTLDLGIGCKAHDDWLKDSLFCEYAYIINFDDRVVEFYKGFNKTSLDVQKGGRYAALKEPPQKRRDGTLHESEYFGVRLVAAIPFDNIKNLNDADEKQLVGFVEYLFDEAAPDEDRETPPEYTDQVKSLVEATGAKVFIIKV